MKTELFPTELTKIDQKKAYWSLMTENGNQNRSWKVSKDHDSGSDSERTRKQNLSKDHDFSSDSERTRRRNLTKDHDSGSDSERTRGIEAESSTDKPCLCLYLSYSVQTINLIVFCQDEHFPYHLTFNFGLVRRPGTHNGGHYAYLDAVLN